MVVASYVHDLDNIGVTTMQILRPRIADTIFKANPTAAYFLARGRVDFEPGGKWIEEPLMYAKNNTVKAYRGYDPLTVAPTEELTAARFQWRQVAGSVTISGLEELQNAGPKAIINNLATKIDVLEMSMTEFFDFMIHAASSLKDLSRDFLGLDELVENIAGNLQGTVGGIDRTTYTWWQNRFVDAYATYFGGVGSPFAYSDRPLTKSMVRFWTHVGKGINKPDLILMDETRYNDYELENHDLLRLATPRDTALLDVGFDSRRFKGATMMWNEHMQSGLVYFLTTKFIRFVIHQRRNFVMTPFVKPYNQDARTSQMLWAGNMTLRNSKYQGALKVDGWTYS